MAGWTAGAATWGAGATGGGGEGGTGVPDWSRLSRPQHQLGGRQAGGGAFVIHMKSSFLLRSKIYLNFECIENADKDANPGYIPPCSSLTLFYTRGLGIVV